MKESRKKQNFFPIEEFPKEFLQECLNLCEENCPGIPYFGEISGGIEVECPGWIPRRNFNFKRNSWRNPKEKLLEESLQKCLNKYMHELSTRLLNRFPKESLKFQESFIKAISEKRKPWTNFKLIFLRNFSRSCWKRPRENSWRNPDIIYVGNTAENFQKNTWSGQENILKSYLEELLLKSFLGNPARSFFQ